MRAVEAGDGEAALADEEDPPISGWCAGLGERLGISWSVVRRGEGQLALRRWTRPRASTVQRSAVDRQLGGAMSGLEVEHPPAESVAGDQGVLTAHVSHAFMDPDS